MDITRKIDQQPKNPKKKKNLFLTILKYAFLTCLILGIVGFVGVLLFVQSVIKDLEDIDPNKVSQQLYENSTIVDREGRVLEHIQSEGLRKVIKYERISPAVIDAFIAVEDKTFLTHNGFNLVRMVGATLNYILKGDELGGVSTITQQLARNVYLFDRRQERSLKRKIEEAYYTIQLEKYLTKEQIMEGYLNLIYFGMESYGVEAACQTYFGKSASEIDYIEAAILVGTVKAPSYYAPMFRYKKNQLPEDAYVIDDTDLFYTVVFNENCINRYKTCLSLMHENGKITEKQLQDGLEYDIRKKLKYVRPDGQEISSYFSSLVIDDVTKDLMEKYRLNRREALELLTSGGLRIVSTIDFDTQKKLESHFEKDNFNYYFGNALVDAVTLFQKDHGLEENGKADTPTLDKLCALMNIDRSLFPDEFYEVGEETEEIQLLKYALNKLGYFVANEYFPKDYPTFNEEGDIIDPETRVVTLRRFDNIIDEEGRFVIKEGDYTYAPNGSLILLDGGPMEFYPHYNEEDDSLERIQIVGDKSFKLPNGYNKDEYISGTYQVDSINIFYCRDILIPDEYKKFDEEGNVVVSPQFLKDYPDFFIAEEDGSLRISPENYVMGHTPVVQPQAAMVILDHKTGELVALVGGRNLKGYMLYNRATNPRQPGSAIKPIAAYAAAMDSGEYSPASVIDDRPVYLAGSAKVRWPVNWHETYRTKWWYLGLITIREAVNQSSNVPPAILVDRLGIPVVIDYLKRFGVTTIDEEGPVNDLNIAALSMGAMSVGISPLEMAQAYACIANDGMLNKVSTYTKVTNNRGEVLLEKTPNPERVLDPKVAYLLKDLLKTSVSEGLASRARMQNHTVYGKTGTTSDNFDVWFVGFTSHYTGAVWFGNDINIPLSRGSEFTADFWRKVMEDLHENLEPQEFEVPEGIVGATVDIISGKRPTELTKKDPRNTIRTDIFIRGFEPSEDDDVHVEVKICKSSGKLATSSCPSHDVETKVMVKRPVPYDPKEHKDILLKDSEYDAPTESCDIHTGSFGWANSYITDASLEFKGKTPFEKTETGEIHIKRPYPIYLKDNSLNILPVNAVIKSDGSVELNGEELIKAEDILRIIEYSAEQLDQFFGLDRIPNPTPNPNPTTPLPSGTNSQEHEENTSDSQSESDHTPVPTATPASETPQTTQQTTEGEDEGGQ